MKEIPLTKGAVAIVDDDDFQELSRHKWHLNHYGYAVRKPTGGKTYWMHREVMRTPEGMSTDHINGNKLDNRKQNLRICTTSQNMSNRREQCNNSSGYKGVFWSIKSKKWRAQIRLMGKSIHLGTYDTTAEAAVAYNGAAKEYFGEFASLNKIK